MVGGWSLIIRFACHIPVSAVGFTGRSLYNSVKTFESTGIFDVIPHGREFLYGLYMYSGWGIFAFAWNFIMSMGCTLFTSWPLVALGVIDSMIAITLAASAGKQARFLPTKYSDCGGATDWRNGTDGRNFFLAVNATTFKEFRGPNELCHEMVETWAYTVSVVVLYGLIGVINILLGVVTSKPDQRYNTYTPARHGYNNASANRPGQSRGRQHNCLVKAILWLLAPAIWVLDHPIAGCRLGYRLLCKLLLYAKRPRQKTTNSSQTNTTSTSTDPSTRTYHIDRPTGPPSPDVISPAQGTVATAAATTTTGSKSKNQTHADKAPEPSTHAAGGSAARPEPSQEPALHFIDLTSTTRASKKLRLDRFGSEDPIPADGLADLASATCHPLSTAPCDICAIQTCATCRVLIPNAPAPSPHLTSCVPRCPSCFYTSHCRLRPPRGTTTPGHATHSATCPARAPRRPWRWRFWRRAAAATDVELVARGRSNSGTLGRACRNCAGLSGAERRRKVEEKERAVCERREEGQVTCGECSRVMGGKARFWVCGLCGGECKAGVHPPWGR